MANNTNVNKVVYDGNTLIDVSDTTATASDVLSGKIFTLANGAKATGTLSIPDYTYKRFSVFNEAWGYAIGCVGNAYVYQIGADNNRYYFQMIFTGYQVGSGSSTTEFKWLNGDFILKPQFATLFNTTQDKITISAGMRGALRRFENVEQPSSRTTWGYSPAVIYSNGYFELGRYYTNAGGFGSYPNSMLRAGYVAFDIVLTVTVAS